MQKHNLFLCLKLTFFSTTCESCNAVQICHNLFHTLKIDRNKIFLLPENLQPHKSLKNNTCCSCSKTLNQRFLTQTCKGIICLYYSFTKTIPWTSLLFLFLNSSVSSTDFTFCICYFSLNKLFGLYLCVLYIFKRIILYIKFVYGYTITAKTKNITNSYVFYYLTFSNCDSWLTFPCGKHQEKNRKTHEKTLHEKQK